MSKALGPLIRLRRWRLDEEKRQLAAAQQAVQRLEDALSDLQAEIEAEQAHARDDPVTAGAAYAAYARQTQTRRSSLEDELAAAEETLARQRDEVRTRWRELRTVEMVEEERKRRQRAVEERREQLVLDENAQVSWLRNRPGPA